MKIILKSLIVLTLFFNPVYSADNNQLDKLFKKLFKDSEISARETEMKIWSIWTTHPKDQNLTSLLSRGTSFMNNQELNDYVKKVVSFAFDANKYFNDSQPWAIKEKNPERMNAILFTIVEQIKNISILLNPIIPNATNKVLNMINIPVENITIDKIKDENILNNKKELGNLEILFTKIEDDN